MSEAQEVITKSFNKDFCSDLEFHLSGTFGNSTDPILKYFWCDGIDVPNYDVSLIKEYIINAKKIATDAWIGPEGQGRYRMIIKLGPLALDLCAKGLDLKDSLPDETSMDWVNIDIENKQIELQLK